MADSIGKIDIESANHHGVELPQMSPVVTAVHEQDQQHPNMWSKIRHRIREPAAEFLGTMILVMFGLGVNCQVVLSSSTAVSASPKGSYDSAVLAWGVGAAAGVWTCAGISGGHINPAVTLAFTVLRRFPLRKFPIYALAQTAGAFIGSLIVYGNYAHAIDQFEGGSGVRTVPGTAGLFATFPLDYVPNAGSFFNEFLATALLMIIVCAVTDKRNKPPPSGLVPLVVFFAFVGIPAAFGMQTSFAMNPARDFGPRLMTAIFYGRKVWTFRHQYWIWAPILGPFCGGIAGAGVYDLLIFTGPESRINFTSQQSRKPGMPRTDTYA